MSQFDLDEGAVLEHIEGIIRRLETGIAAGVLHGHSRPVIHPAVEAQGLGLVQKAGVQQGRPEHQANEQAAHTQPPGLSQT